VHLNQRVEETTMRTSAAALRIQTLPAGEEAVVETTLLELVTTLGELTEDDREVVATVVELLRSGRVRLIGNFRGQKIAVA
jgi:predicted nucleic-acid-binding protein